ncbi:WXG100 family type VII secretion target [Streptomyces griseorubiginosus]|uniref:WXG100 family type VII secretion target n=1 Tax=Streptomyces griseorubiginosus TaxID=67304 RepID=UPI0036605DDF
MGDKDIDDFQYVETNQCISAKHSTPFGLNYDMDQMKDMVRDADPGTVTRVAAAWEALSKDLVGPGGIKEALDAAVEHVLAHWEGQSADLFRQRAQVISTKITDSSKYASHTSVSLRGAAAKLEEIKPEVMAMEKPGKVSSALDYIGNMGDRDDSGANNALKSGESSQAALDGNAGSLSEGREAQLRMAVKMEALGAAYNSRAAEMGLWKPGNGIDHADDYPGDPGVAPAPVIVPAETATRSPQRVTTSNARSGQTSTIGSSKGVTPPSGITGGAHKPTVAEPQVGTAIDGISGGRTGAPTVGGGVGSVGGGSAAAGGIGGGAGFVGGAVGGAAGAGAARGGLVGRAGAGAGAGGIAGRAGAGGVGGAKGTAGRVGGTARGGVVGGTPKSGTGAGRGTTGGSGLHSSRGAAGKGASAVRKGGIAGAPGSRTGRRKEDEQHEGERPDYLVEDEETWTPQTNAAPRVIE